MIDDIVTASLFGNKIPREGTETQKLNPVQNLIYIFGNKIPREGTETSAQRVKHCNSPHLEIRYPERGRKLYSTCFIPMNCIIDKYLEIRYPERGRKLEI